MLVSNMSSFYTQGRQEMENDLLLILIVLRRFMVKNFTCVLFPGPPDNPICYCVAGGLERVPVPIKGPGVFVETTLCYPFPVIAGSTALPTVADDSAEAPSSCLSSGAISI